MVLFLSLFYEHRLKMAIRINMGCRWRFGGRSVDCIRAPKARGSLVRGEW